MNLQLSKLVLELFLEIHKEKLFMVETGISWNISTLGAWFHKFSITKEESNFSLKTQLQEVSSLLQESVMEPLELA